MQMQFEDPTDNGAVFLLKRGEWRVKYKGIQVSATWEEKGPALACLSLLRKGKGIIQKNGVVKWNLG